jgi:hypothetical protein
MINREYEKLFNYIAENYTSEDLYEIAADGVCDKMEEAGDLLSDIVDYRTIANRSEAKQQAYVTVLEKFADLFLDNINPEEEDGSYTAEYIAIDNASRLRDIRG